MLTVLNAFLSMVEQSSWNLNSLHPAVLPLIGQLLSLSGHVKHYLMEKSKCYSTIKPSEMFISWKTGTMYGNGSSFYEKEGNRKSTVSINLPRTEGLFL